MRNAHRKVSPRFTSLQGPGEEQRHNPEAAGWVQHVLSHHGHSCAEGVTLEKHVRCLPSTTRSHFSLLTQVSLLFLFFCW